MKRLLLLFAFILFVFLLPSLASAYNMGTINIKINGEKNVSVDDNPNTVVNGTWTVVGTCFKIKSNDQYYRGKDCTIVGVHVGTGTLKWSGQIGGNIADLEWTVNVKSGYNIGDYFQDYTAEGKLMLFTFHIFNDEECAFVSPPKYGTACTEPVNGKVTIPSTAKGYPVRLIEQQAFYKMNNLTDLIIPSSVTHLAVNAEYGCLNLKTIICLSETPPQPQFNTDTKNFFSYDTYYNATLYVPKGSVSKYRSAEGWSRFRSIEGIEDPEKEVQINSTNFPDKNFRDYLLSLDEGKDGKFSESEISKMTFLSVHSKDISSLKGIEYFTSLTSLSCGNNQLTSMDISNNSALTDLSCGSNQLTTLDISSNTALTDLSCDNNQLSSLDVSSNTVLTYLNCSTNHLSSLDVSRNTALTDLRCDNNQLSSMDVSRNMALTNLSCNYNQLSSLDVSQNTALTSLTCYNNQLGTLDVSKNLSLSTLKCQTNNLKELDVSKNSELNSLACGNNQLTSLDISQNTNLLKLWCNSNLLKKLDISKNKNLQYLNISQNQIRGSSMDDIINYLPMNTTTKEYSFFVYNPYKDGALNRDEGNVCTKDQVAAIIAKGWTPLCYNGTELVEYEGSQENEVYKDGDFFTVKTEEGIDMSFQIIDVADKTCQVMGQEENGEDPFSGNPIYPAISNELTGTITIPSEANGFEVVKIGDTAFSCCSFEFMILPNTVVSIGEEAFLSCRRLKTLIIPNSVNQIDSWIVYGCKKLESIISYIQKPHDIDEDVFWSDYDVFTSATLYVPKGTKSKYQSKKGWRKFGNIVEFDPLSFDPTTLGINEVSIDDVKDVPIYDISGQKLAKPRKGINIIGSKKVVMK